jgi:hypothetical protein
MIPIFIEARAKASQSGSPEVSRWSFINFWKVEDQGNDRRLPTGTVAEGARSAPEQRSFARRSHQRSFKAWSQERHD